MQLTMMHTWPFVVRRSQLIRFFERLALKYVRMILRVSGAGFGGLAAFEVPRLRHPDQDLQETGGPHCPEKEEPQLGFRV